MKNFIWIIQDGIIKSDLGSFKKLGDINFYLYSSSIAIKSLTNEQKKLFKNIISSEDFEIDSISNHVKSLNLTGDIHFVTNDESCELSCHELEKIFGKVMTKKRQLETFTNKAIMKEVLQDSVIRTPKFCLYDRKKYMVMGKNYCYEISANIGFPMIAKPIDKYASMDVKKLSNIYELMAWCLWANSPKDIQTYELEEFIDGELYHCDSIIKNGEIIWENACQNLNPCLDYMEGKAIGAATLPVTSIISKAILDFNRQALKYLNPPNGLIHLECFLTYNDELVFLEVASRPPGGDVVGMYQYSFGFDIDFIHIMLRQNINIQIDFPNHQKYAAWISFPTIKGKVLEINNPTLVCQKKIEMNIEIGDQLNSQSTNIVDLEAAVFRLYTEEFSNLKIDFEMLRSHKLYTVAT